MVRGSYGVMRRHHEVEGLVLSRTARLSSLGSRWTRRSVSLQRHTDPVEGRAPSRPFRLPCAVSLICAVGLNLFIATTAAAQTCPADCNGDLRIVIDELVTAVRIALAQTALDVCAAADADGDGQVRVNDLVTAVGSALRECARPTATPTSTVTPTSTSADHTPSWASRQPLPAPRQELGVAALNGRLYAVGGFDGASRPTSVVEYYEPASDMWFDAAPLPQPLHHVPVAATGGRLYAIGGLRGSQFTAVDVVFVLDPLRNEWETRTPLPLARGAGAAAVIDGRIYVAGGVRNGTSIKDFAVFDPEMNAWTQLPPMPTPRDHLAAAAIDGIFYAVGGRAGRLFDVLEAYDPESRTWTTLAPMPTARGGLAAAALGGRLFTFGGEGNVADPQGIFPQTEAYDVATNTWAALPDLPTPRHGMGAAVSGERIYVPGGATVAGFQASAVNEALQP